MSTNYHSQHAPFGAFASFTLGLHDAPGGFGLGLPGPADQNIYVGFRTAGAPWQLLPFFRERKSLADAFTADHPSVPGPKEPETGYRKLRADEFGRELKWASDEWTAGRFRFTVYSPFARLEAEAALTDFATAPALAAELTYDNRGGEAEMEVIFGLFDPAQPPHPIDQGDCDLAGFASGSRFGYAARHTAGLRAVQGHSVLGPSPAGPDGYQRIGAECALILRIPAGGRGGLPLALGFFESGVVTTGVRCQPFYRRYFSSLESVLAFGVARHSDYVALAGRRDDELLASRLAAEQRWLLAQATHSYYGSTQLLESGGGVLWNVNEGEYRMINTFDLTVDHLFFELQWHPWAVRNVLQLYAARYSYHDTVRAPDGRTGPGGISFTHDMGVANQFAPPGRSSYECVDVHGCFSQMTMEQLVNWVLCAISYADKTGDWAWLQSNRTLLISCRDSLQNRDDPDPAQRNGVMKWDSQRCGSGSELTTYDSLDPSLGQARNSLYLAVKTLAAWLLLEHAFGRLGLDECGAEAGRRADLLARSLSGGFDASGGYFPAILDGKNAARILPAVEGWVFPLYLQLDAGFARDGRFGRLLSEFEQHLSQALQPGVCLDAISGGWKISSTSRNTWMSKIALAQHVTRMLFPRALSPAASSADGVHAAWQQTPGCGRFAMCDQVHSETGSALGSKYYPRGVTAILWLRE